jgi:hypothetical protein
MAGRILNRRVLREQADAAEQIESTTEIQESNGKPTKTSKAKKLSATPKVRKPRAKKAKPRIRVRWGIFNSAMKQVAIFDYNMRGEADQKLEDLLKNKSGLFVIQPVKEEMREEEVPAEIP